MLPVELWEPNCKSSSLPADRKYQKEQSRGNYVILLFNSKYKLQWKNVIFHQDKHNIQCSVLKYKVYVYLAQNWGKA
jgi:hypothetical protein